MDGSGKGSNGEFSIVDLYLDAWANSQTLEKPVEVMCSKECIPPFRKWLPANLGLLASMRGPIRRVFHPPPEVRFCRNEYADAR